MNTTPSSNNTHVTVWMTRQEYLTMAFCVGLTAALHGSDPAIQQLARDVLRERAAREDRPGRDEYFRTLDAEGVLSALLAELLGDPYFAGGFDARLVARAQELVSGSQNRTKDRPV